MISDHARSVFFQRRPMRTAERVRFAGRFSGMHRALDGWLDVGSRAGFPSSRTPPPWTTVFQIFLFPHDVWP